MLHWCFVSAPPGKSPHDRITRDAARRVGWPRAGEAALLEAVRAPDLDELVPSPRFGNLRRVRAGSGYDPAHHFDRVPPITDAGAFRHAREHVQAQRALAAALAHDPQEAVRCLGRALHAVQDACSHSNLVDLDEDARDRFLAALLEGGAVPPEARLVSFLPSTPEPGLPDDPFPHDRFCKDSPHATPEAALPHGAGTKFDAAVEAATDASAEVLGSFLETVGTRDGLADLEPHHTLSRVARAAVVGVVATAAAGVAGWMLGRR